MGLETGTYINSLVATNPTGSDQKSQGDDHLRLIKSTLLATFPAVTGAVTPTHTELNFVDGVTSAIQTQIGNTNTLKADKASPTFTGTVVLPSTTSIGTVSATELGYVDGVTSAIQAQIDLKSPLASPTFTGTVVLPSTTSIGTVSSTEIGYVDGVTSAIQTQIDTKGAKAGQVWTGTQDFTGATTTVAAPTTGSNPATKTYADNLAFSVVLPSQTGNSGKFITTDGTTASWTAIPATQFIHVRDQKASGTAGGTSSTGQNVRVLNTTVTNTLTGASLASNIVTLPAGTYEVFAWAPCYDIAATLHKLALYNHTDSADIVVGPTSKFGSSIGDTVLDCISGRFTLATGKGVKLQHYISAGYASSGLGLAATSGQVEVYAELMITKVA